MRLVENTAMSSILYFRVVDSMKLLNQLIKIIVIFHADDKIEPVKFGLDGKVVMIQKILKIYEKKQSKKKGVRTFS